MRKSTNKSAKEKIYVNGEMIVEPMQYVIRCHTRPSEWVKNRGFGKNMKKGYYLTFEGGKGEPVGTNDINKAHVFNLENSIVDSYTFPWDEAYIDYPNSEYNVFLGEYFEPIPVEVERIVKVKK